MLDLASSIDPLSGGQSLKSFNGLVFAFDCRSELSIDSVSLLSLSYLPLSVFQGAETLVSMPTGRVVCMRNREGNSRVPCLQRCCNPQSEDCQLIPRRLSMSLVRYPEQSRLRLLPQTKTNSEVWCGHSTQSNNAPGKTVKASEALGIKEALKQENVIIHSKLARKVGSHFKSFPPQGQGSECPFVQGLASGCLVCRDC